MTYYKYSSILKIKLISSKKFEIRPVPSTWKVKCLKSKDLRHFLFRIFSRSIIVTILLLVFSFY
jgi:hypothetical protein